MTLNGVLKTGVSTAKIRISKVQIYCFAQSPIFEWDSARKGNNEGFENILVKGHCFTMNKKLYILRLDIKALKVAIAFHNNNNEVLLKV
jgi:hypothetical protein